MKQRRQQQHQLTHGHVPATADAPQSDTDTERDTFHLLPTFPPSQSLTSALVSSLPLYVLLLCFRSGNSLLVRSYFNPDDPWQSLEVAYSLVFPPYGHRTWEWREPARIRGWLHPLFFSLYYALLRTAGLDTAWSLSYGARLWQAVLVAAGDVFYYRLAQRMLGVKAAKLALLLYLSNWFICYCIVRTYSNSLETVLTIIALCYWPLPLLPADSAAQPAVASVFNSQRTALLLAAIATVIRPTSALTWAFLSVQSLIFPPPSRPRLFRLYFVLDAAVIGSVVLLLSCCLDRAVYGEWELVAWSFFRLNSLQAISALYGSHSWHWYWTEAAPVMLAAAFPLLLHCAVRHRQAAVVRLVLPLLLAVLAAYSTNPHKEYRFILPLLPLALLLPAHSLSSLPNSWSRRKLYIAVIVLSNAALTLYFSLIHQSGPISAVSFLSARLQRLQQQQHSQDASAFAVHHWLPCHSAPLYSHLHVQPMPELRFFDCSPTIPSLPSHSSLHYAAAFSTECTASHLFAASPLALLSLLYNVSIAPSAALSSVPIPAHCLPLRQLWQQQDSALPQYERRGGGEIAASRPLPSHVLLYSPSAAESIARDWGYEEVARFHQSHFDSSEREMLVMERLQLTV